MTTDNKRPPREFWVYLTNDGCYTAQKYYEPKWEVQKEAHRLRIEQKWIRTVDYDAYQSLQTRVARLEQANETLREVCKAYLKRVSYNWNKRFIEALEKAEIIGELNEPPK